MRVLFLLIVAALLLSSQRARAGDLAEVKARGELVWGGDLQGGEPFVFEDEKTPGKIRGFEVEIADAIARRLGVRAKFAQNDWSNLVPGLERGDFDMALNGLEDTPDRRQRILLSVPYFVYGETLTLRKGDERRSLSELSGRRVGTLNQTVAHDLLKQQPVEIVLYEGQQEPYFDLQHGRTDAVLLDHIIADRYGCVLKSLHCVPEDVARGVYVIGFQKGHTALQHAVDDALRAMIADGELRRILEGWKLWDARQDELAVRSAPPPPPAPVASAVAAAQPTREAAPAPRHFDGRQLHLFLEGALITIVLSVVSFAIAMPLGLLLAIGRLYFGPLVRTLCAAYIELFRGTPLLLQLYVLYFGLAPVIRLSPMTAAILGLGLNYAAYEAEVQRGALLAIPRGQTEAAEALGLSHAQTLRHVLLPQAFRTALPAVTNDFVALLKDSSLVSVLTVVELTKRMTIAAVDLRDWMIPGLACAGLYFAMSFPLSRLSRRLELKLQHDSHPRPA
ncbi:MAG TPA: ABC transporter substrate-binding protein/permease [Polyangiaceae bacterium]|nr:ABC transporter substrate-binding protein/permease [Polyangiaceae bacterium]